MLLGQQQLRSSSSLEAVAPGGSHEVLLHALGPLEVPVQLLQPRAARCAPTSRKVSPQQLPLQDLDGGGGPEALSGPDDVGDVVQDEGGRWSDPEMYLFGQEFPVRLLAQV